MKTSAWLQSAVVLMLTVVLCLANDTNNLLDAVKRRDHKTLGALIKAKADVNVAQPDGATALAWAIYLDDQAAAEMLLAAGAKVNTADEYGETPLTLACNNGTHLLPVFGNREVFQVSAFAFVIIGRAWRRSEKIKFAVEMIDIDINSACFIRTMVNDSAKFIFNLAATQQSLHPNYRFQAHFKGGRKLICSGFIAQHQRRQKGFINHAVHGQAIIHFIF